MTPLVDCVNVVEASHGSSELVPRVRLTRVVMQTDQRRQIPGAPVQVAKSDPIDIEVL